MGGSVARIRGKKRRMGSSCPSRSGPNEWCAGAPVGCLWLVIAFLQLSGVGRAQESAVASTAVVSSTAKAATILPQPVLPSNTPDYFISPGDMLDIYVFDVPEISRLYRVSPTGFINLPLVSEPIAAAGISPAQLSQVIGRRFQDARLLNHPQVTVLVKETNLHSVVIGGAVKRPLVYPVFGPTRLLQVLSQAEGLADDAGNIAVISRGEIAKRVAEGDMGHGGSDPGNGAVSTLSVDVGKLLETGDESLNLALYPGDRVTVQRAGIVYVIGAVGRPGGFPLKNAQEEMTVLKVLALAGDVTGSARRNKISILRRSDQVAGQRQEVPLNLKKIIAGRLPDQRLYSGDILFVPENGKMKVMRQAVGTGVGVGAAITTGLIIYRR